MYSTVNGSGSTVNTTYDDLIKSLSELAGLNGLGVGSSEATHGISRHDFKAARENRWTA